MMFPREDVDKVTAHLRQQTGALFRRAADMLAQQADEMERRDVAFFERECSLFEAFSAGYERGMSAAMGNAKRRASNVS